METPWSVTISFVVYTVGIVVVGLYSARFASRSTSDYLLARKGLGAWVTAVSASASSESGWVTLGLVGTAFSEGMAAFWVVPGCLAGYAFNWWVLARPVNRFTSARQIYTVPDLMASIFQEQALAVRVISVAVIFFMMTAYVAAQFNAAGKAFRRCSIFLTRAGSSSEWVSSSSTPCRAASGPWPGPISSRAGSCGLR